jgi:hypothetical protein
MTVTRDPPRRPAPAAPAPGDDPLARVGRQLIEAERRLRWRRSRRRVIAGTAGGGLLVAACVAAALPGGPLGGSSGDDALRGDRSAPSLRSEEGGRGTSAASGATLGVRGEVRLHFEVKWGGDADAVVLDRVRARIATVGYPSADVRGEGSRVAVGFDWARGRGSHARQRSLVTAMLAQGQVAFYDWEVSVVDRDGRPIAGRTDRASQRVSQAGGGSHAGMPLGEARAAAKRVPGPTVIVQAVIDDRRPLRRDDPRARFYVLRGHPPVTGTDIGRVREVSRGDGGSAARIGFRPAAHERFHQLTRAASQRGQSLMPPGTSPTASQQHVAIVYGDHLLAVEAIDPRERPDGIDGRDGLDLVTAGDPEQAKALEAGLNMMGGPLPPLTRPVYERGG